MENPPAHLKLGRLVFLLILLAMAVETTMAYSFNEFFSVLPAELSGWRKADPQEIFSKSALYEYIDGGAELYISYGFQKLLAIRYRDQAEEEIVIDIFDQGNSYDAYGVFSHGREREDHLFGQGSEYNSGLLTFWKDRYYISILAYPETAQKKEVVFKLGRLLADAIPAEGELPPILSLLPQDNLLPESIRYFHHYIWVNSHFFIANENILQIDDETQAVLAKYRSEETAFRLLLALYPDKAKALEARESFLRNYLADAQEGVAELSDGLWTGCRLEGNLLAIIFNAPTKEVLTSYLQMVKAGPSS